MASDNYNFQIISPTAATAPTNQPSFLNQRSSVASFLNEEDQALMSQWYSQDIYLGVDSAQLPPPKSNPNAYRHSNNITPDSNSSLSPPMSSDSHLVVQNMAQSAKSAQELKTDYLGFIESSPIMFDLDLESKAKSMTGFESALSMPIETRTDPSISSAGNTSINLTISNSKSNPNGSLSLSSASSNISEIQQNPQRLDFDKGPIKQDMSLNMGASKAKLKIDTNIHKRDLSLCTMMSRTSLMSPIATTGNSNNTNKPIRVRQSSQSGIQFKKEIDSAPLFQTSVIDFKRNKQHNTSSSIHKVGHKKSHSLSNQSISNIVMNKFQPNLQPHQQHRRGHTSNYSISSFQMKVTPLSTPVEQSFPMSANANNHNFSFFDSSPESWNIPNNFSTQRLGPSSLPVAINNGNNGNNSNQKNSAGLKSAMNKEMEDVYLMLAKKKNDNDKKSDELTSPLTKSLNEFLNNHMDEFDFDDINKMIPDDSLIVEKEIIKNDKSDSLYKGIDMMFDNLYTEQAFVPVSNQQSVANASTQNSSPQQQPVVKPVTRRGRKPTAQDDPAKIFNCTLCSRKFKRQEHLKRHFRSLHTGEKPFGCHVCGKNFSRSDNLGQHLKTHNN